MNREEEQNLENWIRNNIETKKIYSVGRWFIGEKFESVKNIVQSKFGFVPDNKSEIIYLFFNRDNDQLNPICKRGKKKAFNNIESGYRNFCSNPCLCKNENQKNKLKEYHKNNYDKTLEAARKTRKTLEERYGITSPLQKEEFKIKFKETSLERYGAEHFLQTNEGKEKLMETVRERYGVDNVRYLNWVVEKTKQTNTKKYGVDNPFKNSEKIREAFKAKYGYHNPMLVPEIAERAKTTLKKIFENPETSSLIINKRKQTCFKIYGFESASKSEIVKEKVRKTNREKFGVDYPLQRPDLLDLVKRNNLKKFGVEWILQNQSIKEKIAETNLERYGSAIPLRNSEVKKKLELTNLERYGVPYVFQSDIIKNKIKDTMKEKYNVENPLQNPEIKKKLESTNLARYGVPYPFQSEEIKEKIKNTIMEKYGVPNINLRHLSKETIEKMNDPEWLRYQHHVLKKSGAEIGNELGLSESIICKKLNKFGIPIIIHLRSSQQKEVESFLESLGLEIQISNRNLLYPYEIDIFIPEKKIGIEYCGLYWHSEKRGGKSREYHKNKYEFCQEKGITLITLFSNEWEHQNEITKKKLENILFDREEENFSRLIGNDTIEVDKRWSNGKILEKYGYVKVSDVEPKIWFIEGKYDNILPENHNLNNPTDENYDWIWDCGWLVYQKKDNFYPFFL